MQGEFFFDDAFSAQDYAKQHPGSVLTRVNGADGYVVYKDEIEIKKKIRGVSPQSILDYLNLHVISQSEAKEEIALALYYHHQKYQIREEKNVRNNGPVMLIGSTGTGKTFLVQKACECIEIPFIHVDTASIVPEGYRGYSISNLMEDILKKSDYDIDKAEHSVVFFDEVDKLFTPDETTADFYVNVAQQMLRMIEGTSFKFAHSISVDGKEIDGLNTSNMQFIFGGAFQWLLDEREYEAPVMGFASTQKSQTTSFLSVEDLYSSGVAKEFLGRVSTIVSLLPLSKEDIYTVLTQSKSTPINKYIDKIIQNGCRVKIPDSTYQSIASEAANHPLGIRSLDFILKRLFKKALFESPLYSGKTYVIDYVQSI